MSMPEWLLKKDNYILKNDKDTFINKSIMSMLKVLTRFRLQTNYSGNKIKVNAVIKVLSVILTILFTALSRSMIYVLLIMSIQLLFISLMSAEEIKHIVRTVLSAALFTFIILIPSIISGNINNSVMIIFKVINAAACVHILSCTSNWNEVTGAFRFFFIPDIFIFVFDITIKYIIILGEFALNMLYALKKRAIGKSKNKNALLSGIIGTMFIKSKEMAEDMYGAMECRGFTGEYETHKKIAFHFADYLCIIGNIAIVFAYIYFGR